MRLTITDAEWLQVLSNVRDVGAAMGDEQVAMVAARAALEALGIVVPVLTAEVDAMATGTTPATARSSSVATEPAVREVAPTDPPETPRKDLRRAARVQVDTDGYCPHCDTMYGAAALAVMDDGNRLCPIHGTVVREVAEVSEGRFVTARQPGQPRPRGAAGRRAVALCEAPIGGHLCAEPVGHTGRHRPRPTRRDGLAE